MNLLITGATGFLGARIVEEFVKCTTFNAILATGRKLSESNKVNAAKLRYKLGDLRDESFVKSLFEDHIDVVVNCASLSAPWGSYQAFYEANCRTQKLLIEESRKASIQRFIYISSPSIYFNFEDSFDIHEDSPLPQKLVNNYAYTKLKAELFLEQSGLSYVILRPRALIGRGDTVIMPRLIRAYLDGKLKIVGSGENRVDLTSVSNMVQAVKLAILTDEANCQEAYNISNGAPVNLWDSINTVLRSIGYAGIQTKIPYALLYAIAYLLEIKTKLFRNKTEPALTRYAVGVLAKSFTLDIKKAQERLNYHPQESTEEAILAFAKWYKNL